jgi:alkaline phosphatase
VHSSHRAPLLLRSGLATLAIYGLVHLISPVCAQAPLPPTAAKDALREFQTQAIATKAEKRARPYHFGSQGPNESFSNHTNHTNRLVPVYAFGKKADLSAFTGANSVYRSDAKLKKLYGEVPPNSLNPTADYADQSDLARLQENAVEAGAKQVFIVLFDGMDWPTTRAAAIARSGKTYEEGKGAGLNFLDEEANGTAQFGYVVTSPTHSEADLDVDTQTVEFPGSVLKGGYDVRFGGANPWSRPEFDAPGYLRGQSASKPEIEALSSLGGVPHAYTDSAASATEIATGVKTFNDSIDFGPDGKPLDPLFARLQRDGWKVGTVTSVPFDHASPACMYARNVFRDDYQDLARDMLGLPNISVERGAAPLPGLDVVIGTGWGKEPTAAEIKAQGANVIEGNPYFAESDLKAIDVNHGGQYVVSQRTPGMAGANKIVADAERAAKQGKRFFGFYGNGPTSHLPYRTADGGFDPSPGIRSPHETYTGADLVENPTLADMTRAAITVLSASPDGRFALFIEPGDVDWALHDNNLDNAIGAVLSGCEAVQVVFDWVEQNSSWDDAVVIVTADHGHYLVLDDPAALAGTAR